MKRRPPLVTGPARWQQLRPAEQEARGRALEAISRMRTQGLSLHAASRAAGTRPATVRRYAGPALVRDGPRYRAQPADRLYRRMVVLTPQGRQEVNVRSSRQASRVADHWNAVHNYLLDGNARHLAPYRRTRIGGQQLATDPGAIEAFARRGELAIDDIYPHR